MEAEQKYEVEVKKFQEEVEDLGPEYAGAFTNLTEEQRRTGVRKKYQGEALRKFIDACTGKASQGNVLARAENESGPRTIVDTRYPFVNRKNEIMEMAKVMAQNIEVSFGRSEDQRITKRLTLLLCAQMFGAGKTVLGTNFLLELKRRKSYVSELEKNFKKKTVTHLVSLKHVFVPLQQKHTIEDLVWNL